MGNNIKSQLSARRGAAWFALSLLVFTVSGCGVVDLKAPNLKDIKLPSLGLGGAGNSANPTEPNNDLIAANLVHTLVQLPSLNPLVTVVQMQQSSSEFDLQTKLALANRGYQIDPVSGSDDEYVVTTEIEHSSTPTGRYRLYTVNIGAVSVERAYEVVEGLTVPVSSQLVTGTTERSISINDGIFESPDNRLTAVDFQSLDAPAPEAVKVAAVTVEAPQQPLFVEEQPVATPTTVEPQVVQQVEVPAGDSNVPNLLAASEAGVQKHNLYEIGQSNYVDVFDGYEDVEQSVLIFPNDSLRLGDSNKQIIDQYVSSMDPDTDVLSVIGCSIGATEIKNGNSLLALGRANRVKEAFLFSGLEHDQILEEGCWAPEAFNEALPHRGVVVTLKRQKPS